MTVPLDQAIANGIRMMHQTEAFVQYEGEGCVFIAITHSASRHGRECLLLLGTPHERYSNVIVIGPGMFDQLLLTYAPAHYAPNCGIGL